MAEAPAFKPMEVDLDNIMTDIGRVGKYQIKHFLLSVFPVIMSSLHATHYIFTAADTSYRCLIPECESPGQSFDPPWIGNAVNPKDKCYRYAAISNATYSSIYENASTCPTELFDKTEKIRCNDYVFEFNNSFVEEVDVVCEDWKRALIGTMHSVGTLIALPLIGMFSDRYGRKTALIVSCTIEGIFGIIKSFSINYPMFVSVETIEQILGSGVYTSVYILALELLLPERRVAGGVAINVSFACGQALLGLIAWGIPYWKTLTLVLYAPALLIVVYQWLIQESNRWLLSKHRYQEVIDNLTKMAKTNGKVLPEKAMESLYFNANNISNLTTNVEIKKEESDTVVEQERSPIAQVFRSKILIFRVLKCSVWWITSTFCFYGLSINSSLLSGNRYTNFIFAALVEIPGHVVALFAMTYFGRKKTIFTAFLLGGLCLLSFAFIPEGTRWLSLLAYLLGKFFVASAFGCVYLYTSELFPTPVRHSLLAACSMIGRIGSILAPQTPLLTQYAEALPTYLFASTCLISALLMLTSPETLGIRLPETVKEAEDIPALREKK